VLTVAAPAAGVDPPPPPPQPARSIKAAALRSTDLLAKFFIIESPCFGRFILYVRQLQLSFGASNA
jgi:hypothetical protein